MRKENYLCQRNEIEIEKETETAHTHTKYDEAKQRLKQSKNID